MNTLFLDTSYLIALEDKSDQYHQKATDFWEDLLKNPLPLFTTSFILDEIVAFFTNRNYHEKALNLGEKLMNNENIQFIFIDETLFNKGWGYFKKHDDKTYSLTDCISFIVMQEHRIETALTFDHHFIQAGFKKLP